MKQKNDLIEQATSFQTYHAKNGLTVMVRSMPEFTGVHAIYGTRFGSADRKFLLDGKMYELPAGTAHFLEHKMFENEEGDAFTLYAKTGASANAYTGFDRTCYLFTATDHIEENLDILLSFVSKPYFTEQTVQKEQGIIGQEIKMYDDAAEWRMLFALYQSLYHEHAVRDDIAGTVQSIAEITPEVLYRCTNAFYRPENMVLAVAGNVTMQTVIDAVERAHIPHYEGAVQKLRYEEGREVSRPFYEFTMPIAKPMLGLGFKEDPKVFESRVKTEIVCELMTELICGSMTPLYRKLYDEGLVLSGFSGESLSLDDALCIYFGGETTQPEQVRTLLLQEIARIQKEGIDEELFTLCKNQLYGEFISSLEAVDDVATSLFAAFNRGRTPAQEIEALAQITKQDVEEAFSRMLQEQYSATIIIQPAQEGVACA